MQKKRLIFNLDGTLLTGEAQLTEKFFEKIYGVKAYPFVEDLSQNLDRYEKIFNRYSYDELAQFLSMRSELPISPRFLKEWSDAISQGKDTMDEELVDTLEHLKKKGLSLAVLTNWFGECQLTRLERSGILSYFDDVYTGDVVLKPHREAYMLARGNFSCEECVFVGNSLERDYIAPRAFGMEGILYDKDDITHHTVAKVKKIGELKENRRIYGE